MSGFLRYVVERSLAGEGDKVKEYAIGIDVFGRNSDYDPRLDSIVRVEARRLRSKVDESYAGAGREDPVVIRLRRGSYVPVFEQRTTETPVPVPAAATTADPSKSRAVAWRVGLGLAIAALLLVTLAARRGSLWATTSPQPSGFSAAVLPFAEFSTDPFDELLAARLTDGVTSQLARLGAVSVVSRTTAVGFGEARRQSIGEIARELKADFVVEGSVNRSDDRVDVSVRLVRANTDRKFWVQDFVGSARNPRELERNIAAAIASALAGASPK